MRGVVLVMLVGCGRLQFDAALDASDATSADASPDAPFGAFGAPTVLGVLGGPAYEDDVTLTGDQLEIYFATSRVDTAGDIWFSTRASTADPWNPPLVVPNVNSAVEDQSVGVSADGLTLYFSSRRPGGPTASNIWVSTRPTRTGAWSTPVVEQQLSSNLEDFEAQPDDSNLRLVMYRSLDATDRALFETTRASTSDPWGPVVQLAALDAPSSERSPCLADHGLTIYFSSDRASGTANVHDLWTARRPSLTAPFTDLTLVDALNSTFDDDDPWVSPDGHSIYFESLRDGTAELWFAER